MISAPSNYTTKTGNDSKCPVHRIKINPMPNLLIGAWKLSEASAQRADYTGRNELTPLNAPSTSAGKVGANALQLTAASSQSLYRLVYDSNCLILNDESFFGHIWVYMDSKVTFRTIASHWRSDGANQSWYLWYNSGTDRFEFNVLDTVPTQYTAQASSFGSPSTGTWYFICFWLDKIAGTVNIQVNNGTVNSTSIGTAPIQGSLVNFRIGAIDATPDDVPDNFWNGRLEQFGFWRRILTTGERSSLYNSGNGADFTVVTDPNPQWFATSSNVSNENLGSYLLEVQELNYETYIDQSEAPLTTLTFRLKDTGAAVSSLVAGGIIGYKVQMYSGYYDLASSDYVQVFGGRISEITHEDGWYYFTCRSFLTAAQDKTILNSQSTQLQVAVNSTDTTWTVADVSAFPNAQSTPQTFRRMILTDTELCDYRGKTKNADGTWNLTSVVRSAATGFPFPPYYGAPAAHAASAVVRYLPKKGSLVPETNQAAQPWLHPMRFMQDILNNIGNEGLGEFVIPLDYSSWVAAEVALGRACQFRYVFREGINGKQLLESMCKDVGAYLYENNDGSVGIKLFPQPTTLHAAWKFEESSGNRADVMHANRSRNYDLTPAGSPLPGSNPGKIGTACQLNSANGQYFWRSYGGLQPAASDFSIAGWVYLDALTSGMTIVGQWDTATNADMCFRLTHSGGRFVFQISNGAGSTQSVTANSFGAPATATWYFVQASYNRGTTVLSISVNDGTVDTTTSNTVPPPTSEQFRVGASGNGAGVTGFWEGRIDELGMWYDHVLTASEITWLYNSGTGRAIETFSTQFPAFPPNSVDTITDSHVVDRPRWLRNGEYAYNHVIYYYDYMPPTDTFASVFDYKDQSLIDAMGKDMPLVIYSKGIRSRFFFVGGGTFCWFDATERFLMNRAEAYIQRFGREAPVIGATTLYKKHLIESADDATVTFDQVVDLSTGARSISNAKVEVSALRRKYDKHVVDFEFSKYP
jgi:hypothetical protein